MSIYKEVIHALKHIKSNSKQIYPDACDFGAPTTKGDSTWNLTKQLVKWYGVEGTRKVEKYSTGTTVSQLVEFMPNEHSSPELKTVEVIYVTTRKDKGMDGYVEIREIS